MSSDKESRRRELYGLLGDLPARDRRIEAKMVSEQQRGNHVLETLMLDLNGIEPVPAYFVRPAGARGPLPTVIYNHAHGGDYVLGKDELLNGRAAICKPPYAEVLAGMGYNALCIDCWNFGERRGRTESELFKEMLWKGRVLWGMMVFDSLKAVDYLCSRPDIDRRRLGTMGISMGSTMAWWLAALDPRIKAVVDFCCLTDFQALIDTGHLSGHGVYYFVPGLLKHFTTAGINALIAPRDHLGLAGDLDPLTPPQGLDRIDRELRAVYDAAGRPGAWKLSRYPCGHQETPEMRAEAVAWIRSRL